MCDISCEIAAARADTFDISDDFAQSVDWIWQDFCTKDERAECGSAPLPVDLPRRDPVICRENSSHFSRCLKFHQFLVESAHTFAFGLAHPLHSLRMGKQKQARAFEVPRADVGGRQYETEYNIIDHRDDGARVFCWVR